MNPLQVKVLLFSGGMTLFTLAWTFPFEYTNAVGGTMYSIVPMAIGLVAMLPLIGDMLYIVGAVIKKEESK